MTCADVPGMADTAAATDIVLQVKRELREWAEAAVVAGIRRERIALDPGFGLRKVALSKKLSPAGNFQETTGAGFPPTGGTSRKSFLGRTLAEPAERMPPLATAFMEPRRSHRADPKGCSHLAHARVKLP